MSDTSSASWENHYRNLEASLTGRDLPPVVDESDFSPPTKTAQERYNALHKLVQMPELSILFGFFREEVRLINDEKTNAFKSSDDVLRAARAYEECVDWMPKAMVSFLAEFDRKSLARSKFMEDKAKQENNGQIPPPPPPPSTL